MSNKADSDLSLITPSLVTRILSNWCLVISTNFTELLSVLNTSSSLSEIKVPCVCGVVYRGGFVANVRKSFLSGFFFSLFRQIKMARKSQ